MRKRFRVLSALAYNDPLYQHGIIEYAHEAGWELDMTFAYYGTTPIHWRGDGIMTHYLVTHPELMNWVRRQRVPVVSLNADEAPYWRGTAPDHVKCGQMAAEYLLSLGFNDFAYFRCSDQVSVVERQRTFQETLAQRGKRFYLIDWREIMTRNHPTQYLGKMLARFPLPLGIFCQSDHRAATLFNACEEAKLHVPEDIAILGVGNNETLCNFSRVPLSSIDTDMERIAWTAAAILDRMMKGETVPKNPMLFPPIGLVTRKSTAVIRTVNPYVAEALRFIVTHSTDPINVNDIVRHVGISRTWLCHIFKEFVGHSIAEELLRVRIEQAKHLLLRSNAKITEIAQKTGFTSYVHFAKSFQRVIGCSAKELRVQRNNNKPFL
ncbi:MAG: substrate-binding domain-containing protein [Planctomycetaceae bacterium]|nr:substrate-binding domain-containing protein [Planctomycetaceae bacterium]